MKIALAQINTTVGAFDDNVARIVEFANKALSMRAELVIFPELCVCSYPPMDFLDRPDFVDRNLAALRRLQRELPLELGVVVGHVDKTQGSTGKTLQNSASLIYQGKIQFTQAKTLLPTYDVFDEARYFEPAQTHEVFEFKGKQIGIAICEDMWWEIEPSPGARYPIDPIERLLDKGAQILVVPSASPFHEGKVRIRHDLMRRIGESSGVCVYYSNQVGGNDTLVFDGNSMFTDRRGRLMAQAKGFEEDLVVVDSETETTAIRARIDRQDDLVSAMKLGLKDYLRKTGFEKVHLGLSGGIDSAIVAVIAAQVLGPEKVKCFLLPSQYSSKGSVDDSIELCKINKLSWETIHIEESYLAIESALSKVFAGTEAGIAEENIQARIRGTLLMSYSNKFNSMLLTTGNKSELSVGYCTLYGDMSGGFGIIGDLFKTEVYELSRWLNRTNVVIPWAIIDKAPSAELRPNQTDQDSLPPYEVLDAILEAFIEGQRSPAEIMAMGYESALVHRVLRLVAVAEYKRWQAAPVLKLSPKSFGPGRRIPIARAFYELS